jgi:hypothetical protein
MPALDHAAGVTYTLIPTTCYALTLSHTGNGADPVASPASSDGCTAGKYVEGATIALSGASPDSGWEIAGWTGTANDSSTADTNSVTMPALDHAAGVTYTLLQNTAPVLAAIGDQTGKASNPLTFTAVATDGDIPAQTLTFLLDTGAPSGASINPTTGIFSWTPTAFQAPGVYPVTVIVTDNGVPALSDEETFTITVTDWSEDWDSRCMA